MPRQHIMRCDYAPDQVRLMLDVYDELAERHRLEDAGKKRLAIDLLSKVAAGCTDRATLLQTASACLGSGPNEDFSLRQQ